MTYDMRPIPFFYWTELSHFYPATTHTVYMKKPAVLVILVCLLVFPAAAGIEYFDSSLYTDDFSKDIHVHGWARGDANPDDTVSIVMELNLEIATDAHNSTTFNWFKVQALDPDDQVIANRSIDVPDLTYGEEEMKTYELDYPAIPDQVHELRFLANHSPVLRGGGRITRKVQTVVTTDFVEVNQSLETFRTNATEAYRDQKIFVNGSVEDVEAINVSGTQLQVEGERFKGWIPLRRQYQSLDTGRQNLTYRITTTRGNVFGRHLTVRVLNRPPSMHVGFDGRVVKGEPVEISVDADDDTGIQDIVLTFQGEERRNRSGEFTINTSRLDYGRHRFNVTVTDVEGKTVKEQHGFNVQIRTGSQGEEGNEGEASGEDDEDGTSSSIPVIGEIRRWLTDFFVGLFS